jgi:hypothetical protein
MFVTSALAVRRREQLRATSRRHSGFSALRGWLVVGDHLTRGPQSPPQAMLLTFTAGHAQHMAGAALASAWRLIPSEGTNVIAEEKQRPALRGMSALGARRTCLFAFAHHPVGDGMKRQTNSSWHRGALTDRLAFLLHARDPMGDLLDRAARLVSNCTGLSFLQAH